MESPFDVLQIESDADEEEITRAYRRRVKETHPDHGGSATAFQSVKEAYEEIQSGEFDGGRAGDVEASGDEHSREDGYDHRDGHDHGDGGDQEEQPREVEVEYLNYEVLDDHGWDLDDDDLFEKASAAGLDRSDRGQIAVQSGESLLEAAEERGFAWPYACRGGACANCAVAVAEGDLSQPVDHILPDEMTDCGVRLSCVGAPTTDETKVVFNAKHLPDLDDLRLPPRPFEQAQAGD